VVDEQREEMEKMAEKFRWKIVILPLSLQWYTLNY